MDFNSGDPNYGKRWWDQHATDVYFVLAHVAMAAALLWALAVR